MNLPEFTVVQIFANARTVPHIPSGTEVILVQDGKASPVKLYYEAGDTTSIRMIHPENAAELDPRVTQVIKARFPEYIKSQAALVLLCPSDLATEMIWAE